MQSKNGGWAAFDRDNTTELVTKIPFCDFGEVLDPPSVDVSAHVVEALLKCGYSKDCECVSRGIKFILGEQEDDGSWFGRWGINYIYGTWCAMTSLKAAGFEYSSPEIKRAADWLAGRQNPDGGWGERASTYMQPRSKSGSTASQTAWALIALMSFETPYGENIRRGLDYLKNTQTPDGTWIEAEYTGTASPDTGWARKSICATARRFRRARSCRAGSCCATVIIAITSRLWHSRAKYNEGHEGKNTRNGVRAARKKRLQRRFDRRHHKGARNHPKPAIPLLPLEARSAPSRRASSTTTNAFSPKDSTRERRR